MTTETSTPEETIIRAVWAFCIREGCSAARSDIERECGFPIAVEQWEAVAERDDLQAYRPRKNARAKYIKPTWEAMAARLREIGGAA